MNSCEIPESLMTNLFISTHLLRKTAYLLAMWGIRSAATDIDMANISACHKDIKSMATYLCDSGTLEVLCKRVCPNNLLQFVGTWQPIHISTQLHLKAMSIDLRPHTLLLAEHSLWFVCNMMKVCRGLPIAEICEKVMSFVPPQNTQAKFETM
jgi:hypothetical protein